MIDAILLARVKRARYSGVPRAIMAWNSNFQDPDATVYAAVAVGTALASGAPRRSVRALLVHTALISDKNGAALFRPRMKNTGGRQPRFCKFFHTVPSKTALLTASAKALVPQPRALSTE